jgi:hypothetical protein
MRLLNEKGEIYLKDKFLSPRLVKEILENKFTIRVIDERSNYIKLRIIRFARLYGFPFIWPQATIEIWINNESNKLIYEFFWPEYLALIMPFAIFLFLGKWSIDFRIFYFFLLLLCLGLPIYLDTRWVVKRIRKSFENY